MKALLPVCAALAVLVAYTTRSLGQQDEPQTDATQADARESSNKSGAEGDSEVSARECILEKASAENAWADCGLPELTQVWNRSDSSESSWTGSVRWWLRGPWAKTIPEYATQ